MADRNIRTGGKAVIGHVADDLVDPAASETISTHSPTTSAGKPVEEQIRREWNPTEKGGLPTFLRRRPARRR